MLRIIFVSLLLTIPAYLAFAQQTNIKDSLKNLLETDLPDKQRADVLNELSYEYFDFNDSLATRYAEQALALSTKNNYTRGKKYAHTLIGIGHISFGRYDQASLSYRASLAIHDPQSKDLDAYCLMLFGNNYRAQARYDSAERFYDESLRVIEANKILKYKPALYKNIALLKLLLYDNQSALNYLQQALAMRQYADAVSLTDIYSNIGRAYTNMFQFDQAEVYYDSMCTLSRELEDYFHEIRCFLNKADLFYSRNNFAEALKFCFDALELTRQYPYPPLVVEANQKIGEIYTELSEYEFASKYCHVALKISEALGLQFETAGIYV
ncbi:MAG: tetratricopeptide repeat protein, partial [Flammeovirgaceae bacterium]|nr:tetratricopeptide repeat protein [Flammeovirgaceae bacterium]